ncbi:receptor-like protein kinase FERONIA-like protein [Corchorus capsularis]|uniref:Receptor-like protein kinase FERONIA-like protein n=1 Tax=Corchorus capsularis TaxID=210143 RepID=A0A1R3JMN8_COCAP|nr:receptor-like protein kinase FERONIA-like protein [Corchorus capsularis]
MAKLTITALGLVTVMENSHPPNNRAIASFQQHNNRCLPVSIRSPSPQLVSLTQTGIIVLSLLGFFVFRRKMRVKDSDSNIDDESPLKTVTFEDDSGEVFSSIGDHVLNSTSTTTFSLTTSDEQSFASKDSDRLVSKAVFSQIGDPQGR